MEEEDKGTGAAVPSSHKQRKKKIYSVPEEFFEQVERIVKLGSSLGMSSLHWYKKDYALKEAKNKLKTFLLYSNTTASFLLAIYFTIQFHRFTKKGDESLSHILSLLGSIIFWLYLVWYIMWIKCSTELAAMVTDLLTILWHFEEYCVFQEQRAGNILMTRLLRGIYTIPFIFSFTATTGYLALFKEPVFFYSDLPEGCKQFSVIFWAMSIFWMTITNATISFTLLELQLLIYQVFAAVGNETKQGKQTYKSKDVVRCSPELIIKYSNILKYYLQYIQEVFGFMLAPPQSLLTRFVMVINFIIIKYHQRIPPFVLLPVCCIPFFLLFGWCTLLVTLNTMSELYNDPLKSLDLYTSRNVADRRYIQKFNISGKKIHFRIGLDEPVTIQSVPQFLLSVSKGTVKLLTMSGGKMDPVLDFI